MTSTTHHHPHRQPQQQQQQHKKNNTTNRPTNNDHGRYIDNLYNFTRILTNHAPWPSTSLSSINYREHEEEKRLETLLRVLQCSIEHHGTIRELLVGGRSSSKGSEMMGGVVAPEDNRWLMKLDKTKDMLWKLVVNCHRRRLLAVKNRNNQSDDADCNDTGNNNTNEDTVAAAMTVENNTAFLMGLLERNNKFWVEERELPYEDVLKMVLERANKTKGGVPKPTTALNILQNLYPFQNLRTVESVLSSIISLQQRTTRFKQNGITDGDGSTESDRNGVYEDYRIDMGTLETISSEASRRARISLILSLWDYLELIQTSLSSSSSSLTATNAYEPTEGMYEDAILTFVRSKGKNDHLALGVLTEMEDRGYSPSRHLVQSLAMGLSSSTGRVQNALYMLQNSAALMERNKKKRQRREKYGFDEDIWEEEEEEERNSAIRPSTASINVILSAYARMGNVDEAFRTYDEFENLGYETNGLTYERLMEAVAMDIETATPVIRRVVPKKTEEDDDENDEEKEMEIESTHSKYETVVSESPTVGDAVQSPDRSGAYEEWTASRLDAAEVVLFVARQRRDRLRRRQRRRQEVAEEGGLDGTIAANTKDADREDIELGPELLHQYVRVLCFIGEVDRARDEVCSVLNPDPPVDAVDETNTDDVVDVDNLRNEWTDVSLKTFALLSSSYVVSNDQEGFEVVRNFCEKAGYKNGLPPYAECRMVGR